jgi:hypothetical protein
VATDVHMKVSHAKWFDPTVEIHAMCTGTTKNARFENKILPDSCIEYYL